MNQENLWSKLLNLLIDNQEKLNGISNFESKNELISSLIHNSLSEENQLVIENVGKILRHYLVDKKISVNNLIGFIKEKGDSQFDVITLEREINDGFDNKFGTLTGVIKEQFMMHDSISMDRYENSVRYHPTPVKSIHLALDSLKEYDLNYEDSIFIDIGSGMGRNLLIASEFPFEKIIGIEISEYLNQIAEKNISIYKTKTQKCKNISSFCADILNFDIPDFKSLVLYFWEPFDEEIFIPFFQKLNKSIKSKDQKVFLIFLGKAFSEVRKSKNFKLKDYKKTNDKFSDTDYFYLSIFSN